MGGVRTEPIPTSALTGPIHKLTSFNLKVKDADFYDEPRFAGISRFAPEENQVLRIRASLWIWNHA
jgi:hypothetical protein